MKKLVLLLGFLISFISYGQTVQNYNYTGGNQQFVVPPCVTSLDLVVAGASGGGIGGVVGGSGAQLTFNLNVNQGDVITIVVGGQGNCGNNSGGFNGGGTGFASTNGLATDNSCGGGGSTDIIVNGATVAVAAGGGGAGGGSSNTNDGGDGGCNFGTAGDNSFGDGGLGGTQIMGGTGGTPWAGTPPGGQNGSANQGGDGGFWDTASGGGGGGGLFGGGGGGNDGCCTGANGGGGGGGGSSLTPIGGNCNGGVNFGDGFVSITYTQTSYTTQVDTFICENSNYTFPNNDIFFVTQDTIHVSNLVTNDGCDSVVTTNIITNPTYTTIIDTFICSGDNYIFPDNTIQNNITNPVTQVSNLLTINGCDSIITTNVNINPVYNIVVDDFICQGDDYTYPDNTTQTINQNTTYVSNFQTINGCDSIITTNLTVNPVYNIVVDTTICNLGSMTFPDGTVINNINQPTSHTSNLQTINGCDSIITINVTLYPDYFITVDDQICEYDSYTFPDGTVMNNITNNQVYISNFQTINGCDSIITTNLTVNPKPNVFAGNDTTVCVGSIFTLNGSGAGPGAIYAWTQFIQDGVPFTVTQTFSSYSVIGFNQFGCSDTDQVFITGILNPIPIFIADTLIGCEPLVVKFTNLTNPDPGINTLWDFGDGTVGLGVDSIIHTYQNDGIYNVSLTVTLNGGCVGTTTVNNYIEVINQPDAFFSVDDPTLTVSNTLVNFTDNSLNTDSYYWIFGDGNVSYEENPSHTYPNEPNSVYTVTLYVSNYLGCSDSTSKNIYVKDEVILYVPNTFTPNDHEYNQYFKPIITSGVQPDRYHLTIFNRWGEPVFESYDYNHQGWDGNFGGRGLVADGVYVWQIEFRNNGDDKKHTFRGHVTVLK